MCGAMLEGGGIETVVRFRAVFIYFLIFWPELRHFYPGRLRKKSFVMST